MNWVHTARNGNPTNNFFFKEPFKDFCPMIWASCQKWHPRNENLILKKLFGFFSRIFTGPRFQVLPTMAPQKMISFLGNF